MFGTNYASRVDKHLGVFRKAINGLHKVRADIQAHVKKIDEQNKQLTGMVSENNKSRVALNEHHEAIGETLSKITTLLPSTKGSTNA